MSRRIQPLPVQLANQIAAGEVVERPASVAKELLENSIDAGADQITIELEQGGLKLLRVTDNGGGIHPDDLILAVTQHATSKIYNQGELERIASLGFRGEALASIASVSRFSLSSRHPDAAHGWQIGNQAAGKGTATAQACALEQGTRIEVRDLFYNTPARRKFLRSERTEYLHVEEVVKRLALSRYDMAFTLLHNGREIYRLRNAPDEAAQQRRIGRIMGQGFVHQAIRLEFEAAGMRLWGWVSPPMHSLAQAGNQYFYLNGRVIRDKLVSHAIRQAHLAFLDAGRHPAYVLYLEIDPAQVDINVHPTKHEVRFRQTRLVHDFLQRALANALRDTALTPSNSDMAQADEVTDSAAVIAEHPSSYRQTSALRPAARPPSGIDTRQMLLLYGRYLLRQGEKTVDLLDMQGLRRELWLARLRQGLADGEMVSVPVLVPQVSVLAPPQLSRLEQQAVPLLRLGLVFDTLGPDSVVLRQLPRLMQGLPVAGLIELLLDGPVEIDDPQWQVRLVDGLLALAPTLSLHQAGEWLMQAERELGKGLPWQPVNEAALQQWISSV